MLKKRTNSLIFTLLGKHPVSKEESRHYTRNIYFILQANARINNWGQLFQNDKLINPHAYL